MASFDRYTQAVAEPDYYKARAKKICNTFIGVYIRNCKQIIKKSKAISQFIGVYIRNLHKKLQKKIWPEPGRVPGVAGR